MGLKKAAHKINSSLATIEFTNKELYLIQKIIPFDLLKNYPEPTISNPKHLGQLCNQIRVAVFAYHVEIMQQALHEYLDKINKNHQLSVKEESYINQTIQFLRFLRNALVHAKGELIPRWDITEKINQETKQLLDEFIKVGFSVNIPIIEEEKGYRFNEKSKNFKSLNFKIKKGKNIVISQTFINEIRLLSWHVLTITKKNTISSLSKYLNHTQ